jgi:hypothetical protein
MSITTESQAAEDVVHGRCSLVSVPLLPVNYSTRDIEGEIVSALLSQAVGRPVCLVDNPKHSCGSGFRCTGKTMLSAAVCHHRQILDSFDIIVWLDSRWEHGPSENDVYDCLMKILTSILIHTGMAPSTILMDTLSDTNELCHFIRYLVVPLQVLLVLDDTESKDIFGTLASLGCKILGNASARTMFDAFDVCYIVEVSRLSEVELTGLIQKSVGTSDLSGSTTRGILALAEGCPRLASIITFFKSTFPQLSGSKTTSSPTKTRITVNAVSTGKHCEINSLQVLWEQMVESLTFQLFVKVLLLFPLRSPMPLHIVYTLIRQSATFLAANNTDAQDARVVLDTLHQAGLLTIVENRLTGDAEVVICVRIESSIRRWFWKTQRTDRSISFVQKSDIQNMTEAIVEYSLTSSLATVETLVRYWQHLNCLTSALIPEFRQFSENGSGLLEVYGASLSLSEQACYSQCQKLGPSVSRNVFSHSHRYTCKAKPSEGSETLGCRNFSGEIGFHVGRLRACLRTVQVTFCTYASRGPQTNTSNAVQPRTGGCCTSGYVFWNAFIGASTEMLTVNKWVSAWIHRTDKFLKELLDSGNISYFMHHHLSCELLSIMERSSWDHDGVAVSVGTLAQLREELYCALVDSGNPDEQMILQYFLLCFNIASFEQRSHQYERALQTLENLSVVVQQCWREIPEWSEPHGSCIKAVFTYYQRCLPLRISRLLSKLGRIKDARAYLEGSLKSLVEPDTVQDSRSKLRSRRAIHVFLYQSDLAVLLKNHGQPKRSLKLLDKLVQLGDRTTAAGVAKPGMTSTTDRRLWKSHPVVISTMFTVGQCCALLGGVSSYDSGMPASTGHVFGEKYLTASISIMREVLHYSPWQCSIDSTTFLERILLTYRILWAQSDAKGALKMLTDYMVALNNVMESRYQARHNRKSQLVPSTGHLTEGWIPADRDSDDWEAYISHRTVKLRASFVARILFFGYLEAGDILNAKTVLCRAQLMLANDCVDDPTVHRLLVAHGIYSPFSELREVYYCQKELKALEGDAAGATEYLVALCSAQVLVWEMKLSALSDGITHFEEEFEILYDFQLLAAELTLSGNDYSRTMAEIVLLRILDRLETIAFRHLGTVADLSQRRQLHQNFMAMMINVLNLMSSLSYGRCAFAEARNYLIAATCLFLREFHASAADGSEEIQEDDVVVGMQTNLCDSVDEDEGYENNCETFDGVTVNLLNCLDALSALLQPVPAEECGITSAHELILSDVLLLNRECLLNELDFEVSGLKDWEPDAEERRQYELCSRIESYLIK